MQGRRTAKWTKQTGILTRDWEVVESRTQQTSNSFYVGSTHSKRCGATIALAVTQVRCAARLYLSNNHHAACPSLSPRTFLHDIHQLNRSIRRKRLPAALRCPQQTHITIADQQHDAVCVSYVTAPTLCSEYMGHIPYFPGSPG